MLKLILRLLSSINCDPKMIVSKQMNDKKKRENEEKNVYLFEMNIDVEVRSL